MAILVTKTEAELLVKIINSVTVPGQIVEEVAALKRKLSETPSNGAVPEPPGSST